VVEIDGRQALYFMSLSGGAGGVRGFGRRAHGAGAVKEERRRQPLGSGNKAGEGGSARASTLNAGDRGGPLKDPQE